MMPSGLTSPTVTSPLPPSGHAEMREKSPDPQLFTAIQTTPDPNHIPASGRPEKFSTFSSSPIPTPVDFEDSLPPGPTDEDFLLVGCDGGVYRTYDYCKTWLFCPNLPLTQFYKVSVDYDYPFYNVAGGTQDNNSQYGPSRTASVR